MPTLLIVDDHDSFRSWARRVMTEDGFDVVGEAADGASAIHAVTALRPDVTLLDILLPDMTGFEVAEVIRGRTAIVLTSSRAARDFGPERGAELARGFIEKRDLTGRAVVAAVRGDDD
ncbi:response regulator [Microbacterium sp.]|uniref:response regulator n=1 Tax=Microbacterium sp. TaxID=51671 RepID=UPI003C75B929